MSLCPSIRFLLSVITTMVKKTSPELEAVLEEISRLKGGKKDHLDLKLNYMCFLLPLHCMGSPSL